MDGPVILDISRALWRRWKGVTPSGIDRVCDAYAARFADNALAALQLRGRMVVLNHTSSAELFSLLDLPTVQFRRKALSILPKLPWSLAAAQDVQDSIYLNTSHSEFDLDAHWRALLSQGIKPVYLLHDLIPITHPGVTTPRKSAKHHERVVRALQGAAGIIVNSHATETELRSFADRLDLPIPHLLVAPIAGATLPIPIASSEIAKRVFVSVGTIEARKNHMLLLHAWSLLIERLGEAAPRLVLAGNWGLRSDSIRSAIANDPKLQRFVEVRTGLDDAELAELVVSARAVLLSTQAEGFGLPMVEALRLKVPVIATDLPSFREVGQGIPTLIDSTEPAVWADTIAGFCANGAERQRQMEEMDRFNPSTWESHFAQLDQWLTKLHAHPCATQIIRNDTQAMAKKPANREARC